MNITKDDRRRAGANSLVRATRLGMAAPRPAPVRKRRVISCIGLVVRAQSTVRMPNSAVHVMTVRRCPYRFARGDKTRYPTIKPTIAAEKIGPSEATGRPHSRAIAGATKLIAWVSKPSRNMTAPARASRR